MSKERVLITGATSYIGCHCVRLLLNKGYNVRGTIQHPENKQKVLQLLKLASDQPGSLELVKVNLLDSECLKEILKFCDYVLHIDSSHPISNEDDENKSIQRNVQGIINMLKACNDQPKMKRIVLTSSICTITGDFMDNNSHVFSEYDWPDTTSSNIYIKSKTIMEKAAWEFMRKIQSDENNQPTFELTTVNPGTVLGPDIIRRTDATKDIPYKIMTRESILLPAVNFPAIDVRDVALCHYKAMISPDATGYRHLLMTDTLWYKDVAMVTYDEFGPLGYDIPTREIPMFIVNILSCFHLKVAEQMRKKTGNKYIFDNTRMKTVLDIDPIPLGQSILDSMYQMIENGQIDKTDKFQCPDQYRSTSH